MENFIKNLNENIDALEDVELSPDTKLSELESWDSIALLSTMAMISSEYGITMKGSEISDAKSVSELFSLIQSKM